MSGSVNRVMLSRLGAHTEPRSWGDRLANKWNFVIPGLPESVEVHAQRLGQTGEHTAMAKRFVTRRVPKTVNGLTFLVPAPEERVIVATLQRMYRHFYFRVCDIVNTAALLESGQLDFAELKKAADLGGIWPGVATYLKIVCDYVREYRGDAPELPEQVLAAARFGGEVIFARGKFLRVPDHAQRRRPLHPPGDPHGPARRCAGNAAAIAASLPGLGGGSGVSDYRKRQRNLVKPAAFPVHP